MYYQDFKGTKVSALGFGCMRLPVVDGAYDRVDMAAFDEMVDYAMEHGVNYFDTGYGYHDGMSEVAMGQSLARYPRDSWMIADKFPGYDTSKFAKIEETFEEQLKRCNVEYFDFYLLHNVCELNIDHYLDEKNGLVDFLQKQMDEGRIRRLGFSTHASYDVMERFLKRYGDRMEFCQIQLNYADWTFQDAKAKVRLLARYGLPVWVMEPVRGGKLTKFLPVDAPKFEAARPGVTPVEWAFRFLQSVPEVAVVLSGMSDMRQLRENIETFAEPEPLNDEEMKLIVSSGEKLLTAGAVPCTQCRYCTTYCPQELDIPRLIELYNETRTTEDGGFIAQMALAAMDDDKLPSACVKCRSCESVCPQRIGIPDILEKLAQGAEQDISLYRH